MTPLRILLLGGTAEATALARAVADDPRFATTLSLAGRTSAIAAPPVALRVGGFGGVDGLAQHLRAERIDALVDATHPFAQRISANAVAASRAARVPVLALRRWPWQASDGDDWRMVPEMTAAAHALGVVPRRVFLTIGQLQLRAFLAAPHHQYLIRSIEAPPPEALPPRAEIIAARGPFDVEAERAVLVRHRIEVIVTKNSGGTATRAKLEAARALHLPVIMVERPPEPTAETVAEVKDAVAWLERLHAAGPLRRGV